MSFPPLDSPQWHQPLRAFAFGMAAVRWTILSAVLFVTYIGIGALAHDTHFSLAWALLATLLVWAGPAQIILISTLASGASVVQLAIAVTVSAVRLFPMVVAVLPMMRTPQTKRRQLVLVAHFTAVTLWVECYRFLPHVPRERRIAFVHGLGSGLDEGSDLMVWVRAVATAILAGVVTEILVHPPGALASVPGFLRYGAVVVGFIVFMLTRRSIFAGVVSGEVFMLAGKWWLG
jgi:predicted branched-subunit amino acid permease